MIEQWREHLYIFGFLSTFAFGGRFLIQWLASEAKGKSVVPRAFWQLSFAGNLLLATHALIQLQLHVLLVQVSNAVISWRNLDILKEKPVSSFKQTCFILVGALTIASLLFVIQYLFMPGAQSIFRIPIAPCNSQQILISPWWHLVRIVGLLLFNCRFWIQWWISEKEGKSQLSGIFWWISLVGDLLCLVYFMQLSDSVNLIGPIFGLIPYLRNLML